MAYGSRTRKRTPRSTHRRPYRPSQSKKLYTLTKRVNKIQYKQRLRTLPLLFKKNDDFNLAANYIDRLMICPTGVPGHTAWTQVFGANTNASESRCLTIKSLHMKYELTAGDEESLINHTVVMVTPKSRKVLRETLNEATGALTMVVDQDYILENGMAIINKLRWNIKYYKRHMTVQQPPAGSDITYPLKSNMGSINLKCNYKIKNTQGVWGDVTTHEMPYYSRLFLVCFNNNSSIDLEYPTFAHTTLYKCTATNTR